MSRILAWLVILAMPLFLGFAMFRLSIGEAYPRFAYSRPSFPPDPYGWTQAERLDLALVAVDYLARPEPAEAVIFMLEDQRQPGSDEPLYNEREISHMIDVKRVADSVVRPISTWAGVVVALGLLLLIARRESRRLGYWALARGGRLTVIILVAIGLFIVVGWSVFFVAFHNLFFPPGTWTFALSDSLIRLFPEKFWFDYGVILSGSVLLSGVAVMLLGTALWRRAGPRE